ncbi:SGNH/GDSL hydrolase family protein [Candidatus Omnitrophota bacterium]
MGFSLIEVTLRTFNYNYCPCMLNKLKTNRGPLSNDINLSSDPYLIWRPKPNCHPFNSQGMRGRDVDVNDGKNEYYILAVGDSHTCGPIDSPSWVFYLEELLNRDKFGVKVINAGVWGYSSFQMLRRFKECLEYSPQMALVTWCSNDALPTSIPDKDYVASKKFFDYSLKLRLSHLLWAFHDKLLSKINVKQPVMPRVGLEEYGGYLKEIISLAKKNNIEVILLTRPYIGEAGINYAFDWKKVAPTYNQLTIRTAKANNLISIDIYSYFRDREQYFTDESHLTDEGYKLVAKIVYDHLKDAISRKE